MDDELLAAIRAVDRHLAVGLRAINIEIRKINERLDALDSHIAHMQAFAEDAMKGR